MIEGKVSKMVIIANMGDKEKYMNEAVGKIKAHPMVRNVQISELLVTKPYGGVEQDDFVNGAVGLRLCFHLQNCYIFYKGPS